MVCQTITISSDGETPTNEVSQLPNILIVGGAALIIVFFMLRRK